MWYKNGIEKGIDERLEKGQAYRFTEKTNKWTNSLNKKEKSIHGFPSSHNLENRYDTSLFSVSID